jgi:poly-gamma-glutamate capsule biosynthesis protein CapA/YwtB (metallophosphatase superfamily)
MRNILTIALLCLPVFVSCQHYSEKKIDYILQPPSGAGLKYPGVAVENNFSILFTGDVMLVNDAEKAIRDNGREYPFSYVRSEFLKYTFIVINLESPVTERGIPFTEKPYVFRISRDIAESIASINPACLVVGNNHIMDYGADGMSDTISWITSHGWLYCGAGETLADARKPAVLVYGMSRIALLSYNERPPKEFYATVSGSGTAPLNIDSAEADIRWCQQRNNLVIVNVHWGVEMTTYPQREQRNIAHKLIDAGADAVIGHHPHCPQGIEVYKGKLIFYSLGNFITGYTTYGQTDNIVAALHINSRSQIKRAEIIPVAGKNKEIKHAVRFINGRRAVMLLRDINTVSSRYGVRMKIENDRGIIDLQ